MYRLLKPLMKVVGGREGRQTRFETVNTELNIVTLTSLLWRLALNWSPSAQEITAMAAKSSLRKLDDFFSLLI